MVEEDPGQFEFAAECCGQGFDAESLRGVVAGVENIEAQFFRERVGPVRAFAGDEGIHAFGGGLFQVAARAAGHDADAPAYFRSARQHAGTAVRGLRQLAGQFFAGNVCHRAQSNERAVADKERPQLFEAQRRA